MKKKVSIIIPVYNVENYLEKCLDSIVNQTYENIEIILIDDGSNDNSGNICKKYADNDSRIKYIYQINNGVSAARNKGIKKATGEFITFVDSDDWLELNAIESMLKIMNEFHVDMVRTSFLYHIDNVPKKIQYEEKYKDKIYDKNAIQKFENDILLNNKQAYLWILMIKSDIVKQVDFDINLGMMEDTIWLLQILKKVKNIYFSDIVTYNYILSCNSASNAIAKARRNLLNVIYIKKFYDIFYLNETVKKLIYAKGLLGVIVENIHKYCLGVNEFDQAEEFLVDFSRDKDFQDIIKNGGYKKIRIDRRIVIILLKKQNIKLLIKFCKIKERLKGV